MTNAAPTFAEQAPALAVFAAADVPAADVHASRWGFWQTRTTDGRFVRVTMDDGTVHVYNFDSAWCVLDSADFAGSMAGTLAAAVVRALVN